LKNIWKISTIIFIILFGVTFFGGNHHSEIYYKLCQLKSDNGTIYNPDYVRQKSLYETFDCRNKIVFLGDSIISDGGSIWNELLGRNDIVNRGIAGDTTNGVLNRLDFYLNQKPKCIFIMIGVNDIRSIFFNMDTTKSNYSKIINKILENNVQLFVMSTLNTNKSDKNKKIKELNDYLVEQCKLLSIPYIDINNKLSNNYLLSDRYSKDGLHLNSDGYIIWSQVILPYVNKLQ
jgi:lysophospholipase L1-like esterase